MRLGAVLPAGGQGLRMGGRSPKQFREIAPGRAVFEIAVEAFHRIEALESVVLVLPDGRPDAARESLKRWPKLRLAPGGERRWQSVRNGFRALDPSISHVLIHDVARPFVPLEVIERCLEVLSRDEIVLAAQPATDTIKEVSGGTVVRTLDRGSLVQVQTPQGFPRAALEAIYARDWSAENPTDEAAMAENLGLPVRWVRGDPGSRKLTHPEDWEWACWMEERRRQGREGPR